MLVNSLKLATFVEILDMPPKEHAARARNWKQKRHNS